MEAKFGIAFSKLPLKKIAAGSNFMKAFEAVKRDFQGDLKDGKIYELHLNMKKLDEGDPAIAEIYDFEEGMVKITAYERRKAVPTGEKC